MGLPRVSVVMPVHNAAPFLDKAVQSVLDQSVPDFEFLIHDDGSTDGSWDILSRHAKRDPRIKLSRSGNRGIGATLATLMGRAQADLIARMDADDICPPDRFALQVRAFEADPTLSALGGAALIIDAAGRPITVNMPPLSHADIDDANLRGHVSMLHPAVMMRRDDYFRAGGYDERFSGAEDHDLWLRMAEIGQLRNMTDILIHYRIHNKSISGSRRQLQRALCLRACEAAWTRRGTRVPFEYDDWRMEDTDASRLEYYLRYSWQAWADGFRTTARHYALKAVRLAPQSPDAWKALVMGTLRASPARGTAAAAMAGLQPRK